MAYAGFRDDHVHTVHATGHGIVFRATVGGNLPTMDEKKKGFSGAETLGHALVGVDLKTDEAVHDVRMATVRICCGDRIRSLRNARSRDAP